MRFVKIFLNTHVQDENQETLELLRDVQYQIMKIAVVRELDKDERDSPIRFSWKGVSAVG